MCAFNRVWSDPDFRDRDQDAIEGLQRLAASLNSDVIFVPKAHYLQALDICAILCGWAVLVAAICYPQVQLAAILGCVLWLGLRGIKRLVLGAEPAPIDISQYRRTHARMAS